MRLSLFTCIFCLFNLAVGAQILIDDKSGDPVGNNILQMGSLKNLSLLRISSGSQSIGFTHFLSTSPADPANYSVHEFSAKARPTDGLGPLIANGQFAAGIKLGYSYTKVPLVSGSGPGGYVDWGGISVSYDFDKYNLVKQDTTFAAQVYNKNFNALGITLFYNGLIKSKWIVHGRIGYANQNNHEDLTSVDANDIVFTSSDQNTLAQREVVQKKSGKTGNYAEFDGFPMALSITKTTRTDDPNSEDDAVVRASKHLRFGYTAFVKNVMSKRLPRTTIGVTLFLAKQDKDGVRTPVLGLSIQAKDPFDVMKKANIFQKRISVGLTTVFSL